MEFREQGLCSTPYGVVPCPSFFFDQTPCAEMPQTLGHLSTSAVQSPGRGGCTEEKALPCNGPRAPGPFMFMYRRRKYRTYSMERGIKRNYKLKEKN